MFLPPTSPECIQGLSHQLVGSDYENAVRLRVWNIDNAQIAPGAGLTERHSRSFPAGPVFTRLCKNVDNLVLIHVMVADVRVPTDWINVESDLHPVFGFILPLRREPFRLQTPRRGTTAPQPFHSASALLPRESAPLLSATQYRWRTLNSPPNSQCRPSCRRG